MTDPREYLREGVRHQRSGALQRALDEFVSAASTAGDPAVLAEACRRQADVLRVLCRWNEALEAAHRSAVVAEETGRPDLLAEALNAEGMIYHSQGDFLAAVPLYERMLVLTDNDQIRGLAHQNLAAIAADREDFAAAERHFRESYQCFERAAFLRGAAISLVNYGSIALRLGKLEQAEDLCRRALDAARGVEDLELAGLAMVNYAEALSKRGEMIRAEELVSAALGYFSLMENTWRRIECLRQLGDLRLAQAYHDTAAQCYSQALDLAQSIGALREAAELVQRLQRIRPDA